MSDDRNRRVPGQRPKQFLPDIGLDVPQWLQSFLVEAKSRLESLVIDPDPPSQPENLTVTSVGSGSYLQWDSALKAARYEIFRGVTNEIGAAQLLTVRQGNNNVSYLDVAEQATGATLYYWVRGQSVANVEGPLSRMASIANPSLAKGSHMEYAFSGVLGDGRHGAVSIGTSTTATVEVPLYQCTDFTVAAGQTWTAYAQNPGGFMVTVKGRCTIAGTIDVIGRGGLTTPNDVGRNGYQGYNIGGSGGGGGGGAGSSGGHGAPCRTETPMGGYNPGGVVRGAETTWAGDSAATASPVNVRNSSGAYTLGGGTGGLATVAGTSGSSVGSGLGSSMVPSLVNSMWLFVRGLIHGWGSSGGSGGAAGASGGTGGAGGGYVIIFCEELDFTGVINSSGVAGAAGNGVGAGGGGGGGGGPIIIGYRTLIANTGTTTFAGGAGGASGGGTGAAGGAGGDGFAKIFDIRI